MSCIAIPCDLQSCTTQKFSSPLQSCTTQKFHCNLVRRCMAKSLLFKLYNRLFHAYGAQNFTAIFQHSGREFDRTQTRVSIGNFTDANLFFLINNRLRTIIDPTLTLDGFQVSPNEALALS